MKKVLLLLLLVLVGFGLYISYLPSGTTVEEEIDSVCIAKDTGVITFMCKQAEEDCLSVEEIAHWDSMNEQGEYLLIRGAERNLDTVVNHLHLIFTTEL